MRCPVEECEGTISALHTSEEDCRKAVRACTQGHRFTLESLWKIECKPLKEGKFR